MIKNSSQYTTAEILKSAFIGLEIEFFSKIKAIDIAKILSKELNVKVVVPYNVDTFNKKTPRYHSEVVPTANLFKLEIDNSGGPDMHELITGPLTYFDAKKTISKIFAWINANGWSSEKTSIHFNISFDNWKIKMPISISKINKLKIALDIEEDYIYSRFPEREFNVYARSVKDIFLNSLFYFIKDSYSISTTQFKVPSVKYYGINPLKFEKDYAEFRYVGGENYHKKQKEVYECMDYFILLLYENIVDTTLNHKHYQTLKKIGDNHKNILDGYKDYKLFFKNFPGIQVYSDLRNHEEILKTQWHNFRDKLFELIILGKLRKGLFNYDSDVNAFQLKDAKLDGISLNGFEFLNCEIQGHIENSDFYTCKIANSIIEKSAFINDNTVLSSKVNECLLFKSNTIIDSFIDSKEYVINCNVEGGVIRSGKKGKNLKTTKDTIIVDLKD